MRVPVREHADGGSALLWLPGPSALDSPGAPPRPPPRRADARQARRATCRRGRRLDLRAEVGRLPRARLPRRRRALHPEPRREAARPLLPRARRRRSRRSSRRAACSTARSSSPRGDGARLRGAAAAPPPGRVAREDARRARSRRRSCSGTCSALGDATCAATPFRERRARLEAAARRAPRRRSTSRPRRRDRAVAADWFRRFEGAGLDGVMAKPADGAYEPNKRVDVQGEARARLRLRRRAASAGTRTGEGTAVGSLLLGLYDDDGRAAARRRVRELHRRRSAASSSTFLAPYRDGRARRPSVEGVGGHRRARREPGSACPARKSRWSQGKDLSWEPLRPELVVEVAYDHMQGTRFRHTAQFRRWRPDKQPRDCTYEQLEVVAAARARGDLRGGRGERLSRPSSAFACSRHSRVGSSSGIGRLLRRAQRPRARAAG